MSYPQIITIFDYQGFTFTLDEYISPWAKTTEQAIEEFKRMFDYCGEKIVSLDQDEIVVDWKRYFIQDRTHRGEEELHEYIKILIALGILSFKKENNWAVVSYRMFVNPNVQLGSRLFFTRKQDAVEYAKMSGWLISEVFQYSDQIISSSKLKEA